MERGAKRRAGLGRLAAALLIASMAGPAWVPAPASAAAGPSSSPFTPGVPQSQQAVPTQAAPPVVLNNPSSSSSSSGGLSAASSIAVGVGALVVIGGIAFFIWYDARRRAPARAAAAAGAGERSVPGSKRKPKPRKLSAQERRRRKRGRSR